MIQYKAGKWHVLFIFRLRGSVFPKAFAWALPSMLLSILAFFSTTVDTTPAVSQVWSSYNFVLGFLIVFRTQQAYARYWEGASLLSQVRGEWYNSCSSLVAFCSSADDKVMEVAKFQHCLVRLMSLLYCSALQQVADLEDQEFNIIDINGLDLECLKFLVDRPHDKCNILLQWIQRLIVDNMSNGVVPIAPPVLSRVFQELSRGIVNVQNAQKISDVLFPFPYAQMVTVMLLIATLVTPLVAGTLMPSVWWAALLTFVSVFALWSINYIAAEIEMPFGKDPNDLPIVELQRDMNKSLLMLLDRRTQLPPNYKYHPDEVSALGEMRAGSGIISDLKKDYFKMKTRHHSRDTMDHTLSCSASTNTTKLVEIDNENLVGSWEHIERNTRYSKIDHSALGTDQGRLQSVSESAQLSMVAMRSIGAFANDSGMDSFAGVAERASQQAETPIFDSRLSLGEEKMESESKKVQRESTGRGSTSELTSSAAVSVGPASPLSGEAMLEVKLGAPTGRATDDAGRPADQQINADMQELTKLGVHMDSHLSNITRELSQIVAMNSRLVEAFQQGMWSASYDSGRPTWPLESPEPQLMSRGSL